MRLLTEASVLAEAECRRIVAAAERRATSIVDEARQDAERVAGWVAAADAFPTEAAARAPASARGVIAATSATPGSSTVAAMLEEVPLSIGSPPADLVPCDRSDDAASTFFAASSDRDEDPWAFMDDEDGLAGMAPALLRRVLRRPPRSQQRQAS
jgi:hypothetical protein